MKRLIFFYLFFIFVDILFADTMNENALKKLKESSPDSNIINFVILGDNRDTVLLPEGRFGNGDSILIKIVKSINRMIPAPEFVLNTGDVSLEGYRYEYNRYRSIIEASKVPWLTVRGNHELYSDSGTYYFNKIVGDTDFVFDRGNLKIIILSNCHQLHLNRKNYSNYYISKEQLIWLDSILIDVNKSNKIPIVVSHVPPCIKGYYTRHCLGYSRQYPKPNIEKSNVKTFLRMLFFYRVPLAIFGHIHLYDSFDYNGVTFVITGGAGAPLYTDFKRGVPVYHYILMRVFRTDSVKGIVLNPDGNEIDPGYNFTINLKGEVKPSSLRYKLSIRNNLLKFSFESPLVRYITLNESSGKVFYEGVFIKEDVGIPIIKGNNYRYVIKTGNRIQSGSFSY